MIFSGLISIDTKGYGDITDITPQLLSILKRSMITNGLATLFCPGSTGALTTIEYEPGVLQDLKDALERIAPSNIPYRHDERWATATVFLMSGPP